MKTIVSRLLLFFFFILSSLDVSAETLHIFVPSSIRASVIQEKLIQECPTTNITVFAKAKDFIKTTAKDAPDTIIAPAALIDRIPNYSKFHQGFKKNKSTENLLIVAIDKHYSVDQLSNLTIGVVDILGRKAMKDFIKKTLVIDVAISRVTKPNDLIPLLTFRNADAILIPESWLNTLKEKTQLNLISSPTDKNITLSAAGKRLNIKTPKNIERCINAFSNDTNHILGVEQWN